jgi:hypothetical protein
LAKIAGFGGQLEICPYGGLATTMADPAAKSQREICDFSRLEEE